VVSAVVADYLDAIKTVSVPQADGTVLPNRYDLLLLVIAVNGNNLLVVVCDNAVDDPERIRIDQDESAFSASCGHEP
jgi:hypothetical protein